MVAMKDRMAVSLRILCAIALLCVGFAHKVPVVETATTSVAELEQYVFPDGSRPVLCLSDTGDQSNPGGKVAGKSCEACRLGASIVLPAPADAPAWLAPYCATRFMPVRAETPLPRHFTLQAAPRGPPSAVIA